MKVQGELKKITIKVNEGKMENEDPAVTLVIQILKKLRSYLYRFLIFLTPNLISFTPHLFNNP